MSGPVTFSFLDEMQTFGLADYRAAQTRMAIAKERRGIERDTLLRDKHLGDTLRAYEALGFRFPEARQLLLCGIPRDLVASYADRVPPEQRNVELLIYVWRSGQGGTLTGRAFMSGCWTHGKVATAKVVDSWLAMRHKAALAAKMTPSSRGRLVIGLAMAVPGILARSRGRS